MTHTSAAAAGPAWDVTLGAPGMDRLYAGPWDQLRAGLLGGGVWGAPGGTAAAEPRAPGAASEPLTCSVCSGDPATSSAKWHATA